ncbi:MAG: chromosome partitioning protein [Brachybacterium sp.]|nr:chromosome partitioning protein [Brachybacterium sp.]
MIAQARITSDTTATVHLAEETVEVSGANLPEIRDRVKQAFIAAAKTADEDLDVVIVEPDVRHHLRVEPSGRITGRESDQRPVHGPGIDDPLLAPPTDDTAELSGIDRESLRPRTGEHAAIGSDSTDEHAAIGSPATGELPTVRPHGARRRRAAAMPPSARPSSAGSPTSRSLSAGSATSATSAESSATAASAPSASSAPSAASAPSATSAPSALPASSAPSAVSAGSASAAPSASPTPFTPVREPAAQKRPLPARTAPETDSSRPTLKDLQTSTAKHERVKATRGVPGFITRLTRGAISPRPGKRERRETERLERIRRPLDGPRNIAVVNLKGGAHKTTASLMIAATLGVTRGGNVLAWDNNETRGTLGWRGIPTDHHRTAVDLLHDIDRLRSAEASNADLDPYVRPQGGMRFDILASDEDPGSAASIDADAFGELNDALSRFYRIKVIDTGNNVRASNWLAAVKSADQLIIVSTVREDTFNAAAWMIDELRATGLAEQVDHAVTILSHSSKGKLDSTLRDRLRAHFGAHTRAVTEVPYEQQFVDGSHLDWERVSPKTKEAWLDATALIIDGL